MHNFLAQTLPAATPATQAAEAAASSYHVAWEKWFTFYNWEIAVRTIATLLLILLLGVVLSRLFKKYLQAYKLGRATAWAFVSIALYFTIIAAHPYLMIDNFDVLALSIHKTFVAILVIVGIRYLDRLIILPLLTRISKAAPSRFVHQIIIAIITFFAFASYCSWAFHLEIASVLAGSAIISIVLGLALQETLGNFFSGMVLQASVPFKAGDWIQIGDTEGRVIEMTWRAVTLLTGANNNVLIPNSVMAKEKIINYHTPSVATASSISIGLDYNLPPNDAKRVLVQAAKDTPGVLASPEPGVALAGFKDSSILYTLGFWIDQPQKHGGIEEAVRTNVWYRLNQAGYGIPFPTQSITHSDAEKKQTVHTQTAVARRLAALQKSPLFSALDPALLQTLAAESRDFTLASGQTFYREGDAGNSLFLLDKGTISSSIRAAAPASAAPDSPAPAELDAGDTAAPALFGEVSALTAQPREATIRAKTDVHAIEIDQTHLQNLFTQDPALMTHFSQAAADRQKLHDELLQKLGAAHPVDPQQPQPESVLDRMKRLFTRHIR